MSGMISADEIRWQLAPDGAPAVRALSDAELLAQVIGEASAYRALAQQALHALHDRDRELRGLRAARERLLAEYRALRAQVPRAGEAA